MKVHILQHAPFEGLGSIATWLNARGADVSTTRFYEPAATLPSSPNFDLIVAMGGPMSVNDEAELPWLVLEKRFVREAVERGVAVLGVCLGSQLIASALGARVYPNAHKEIGWFPIEAVPASGDVVPFPATMRTFVWHGETFDLPCGAIHLARSAGCAHQAFQYGRRVLALQFHPEVTPEAVQEFVDEGASELGPGPFVQTADTLLSAPTSVYNEANAWMSRALDHIVS